MNDLERLENLVRLFLDGKQLPAVEGIPAVDWLEYLRTDQTPLFTPTSHPGSA